jgi:hypothetical protein
MVCFVFNFVEMRLTRNIYPTLLSLCLILSFQGLAQQTLPNQQDRTWEEMMNDPNSSFFETQQKFKDYWQDKPITKGCGFKAFKRWEWFNEPRVSPSGQLPEPDAVWQAMQDQPEMFNNNLNMPGDWYYIGNNAVPAGGGGAGRINGIRALPGSTTTFFACAPGGGLWKTTNTGASWSLVGTDFLSAIGASDIAIDPTNNNIMYLATGDCDAGDTYALGVLKSIDGGLTWNTTGLSWTVNQTRRTSRILINPDNTQIVVCATTNGIYRTADGGANWSQVQVGDFKDLTMKPGDSNTWYASSDIFYRSVDGGITWTAIASGLPTAANSQRMSIAVSAANSSVVYALCSGNDSGLLGVYRSNDSGLNFTQQADNQPNYLNWATTATNDAGGQGWYDLRIEANPTNADEIYLGGVNIWKSTNGGVNWNLAGHWFGGGGAPYVHADIHALYFVPGTSRLLVGSDGGVFTTTNGGPNFSDISSNLPIAQIYKLSVAGTNANIVISGWQDNGTNLKNGATHTRPIGGDGMDCQINPSNSSIMYGSLYYGAIFKSTNTGANFTQIVGSGGANEDEDGAWVTPYVLGPNPDHIYVGKSRVFISTDGGNIFTASAAFGGTGDCNDLAVAPSNTNIIYASKGASLFKSTDNGATFAAVAGMQGSFITDIAIHNTDPNKVWVTFSNYTSGAKIFYTTNGGASWTNISGTLPNLPANTVVHQPGTNNGIYVGMDAGVYYRDDLLGSFTPYMNALPNVVITDLDININTSTITAASYGRGLWRAPLYSLPTVDAVLNQIIAPTGSYCTSNITPQIEILNAGQNPIISLSIQYQVNANPVQTFNWTGNLPTGNTTILTLPVINYGTGSFTFTANIVSVNTLTDDLLTNNSGSSNYYCINGSNNAMLVLETDCYANEISWTITDSGSNVVYSGSGYSNETTYNIPLCLDNQCYQFNVSDSYGDGISGSGCTGGAGNYYIYDVPTTTNLVLMGTSNYGTGASHAFCYPLGIIPGCLDPAACNYNALATISNGSCVYGPENDLCAGAIELFVNAAATSTTNVGTCTEGPNPSCGGASQIKDVWFKFVYTGGPVTITTNFTGGTLTDTRLAVYSSCGGSQIACNDDIGGGNYRSTITIACGILTSGSTYYVQAGGYQATSGSFSIRVTAPVEICNLIDDDCDGQIDEGFDFDGDGFISCSGDCNDTNAQINPGATEICNSMDDDCDGSVDEGVTTTYYRDFDNDGFGNISVTTQACSPPTGYTSNSSDCNDSNGSIFPGASETCNTLDDDCDGSIDEGLLLTFYRDFDSDGFGNPGNTILACSVPVGYVANSTDCNDSNNNIYPGRPEICNNQDDDCDTQIDEGVQSTFYRDQDNDGYGNASVTALACSAPAGYVSNSTDCNDSNNTIYPGASELCNSLDDDCDTSIDEGVQTTFYQDNDNDGYGNPSSIISACTAPTGYVSNNTDCNDSNININPAATEICNNLDDDCDGPIDEGTTTTYYRDQDNDGFGNVSITTEGCSQPAGYVSNSTDCNDTNGSIYPGAIESCNTLDDNCNGQTDEGVLNTYYRDQDNDGFGNAAITIQACSSPVGYVGNNQDCNDNNNAIRPNATEVCNTIDDDCDVAIDEGFDQDNDGFTTCEGDCNDNNSNIFPGAPEACNGIDDNCDTFIDNGVTFQNYFADNDGDGFGNILLGNFCSPPANASLNNNDCNDGNASINPNELEICNNIDDNCNGQTDEGFDADNDGYNICEGDCNDNNNTINPGASETCNTTDDDCDGLTDEGAQTIWYRDLDGDGYGQPAISTQACTQPAGYVANSLDCEDTQGLVYPGATELCNDYDDDCDGQINEGFDTDNDGFTTCQEDCDDNNAAIYPGAAEVCNSVDDNCDNLVDEGFDNDNDGFTTCSGDCDDNNLLINPSAIDLCNGIDDNCNLNIDEDASFSNYYSDNDSDGYGSSLLGSYCSPPANSSSNNLDCNDFNAAINPASIELCNNTDENCNGQIDEGFDNDNDGYTTCEGDCNDNSASTYPGASESCNNADEDCDGQIDETLALLNWYIDADNDGYGSSVLAPVQDCGQPAGYVANNLDCNDGAAVIRPNGVEICGTGIDEDCDNLIDENCTTGAAQNDNMSTARFVTNTGNNYPFCTSMVSTCEGATISPESNSANVITGEDVWFRFIAPSPGIRVKLSAGSFDGVIELRDQLAAQLDSENETGFGQTECLNFVGLTEGSQYYIVVRNYDSSLGNGNFTLCVQALLDSWCAYGSGTFPICNNYKSRFTHAHSYTFRFIHNITNVQTTVTGNGLIPLSHINANLVPGESYTVFVDATYNLDDGEGDLEVINVVGNDARSLTIAPHSNVQVKLSQRCPAILYNSSFLVGAPQVCGAQYFRYEFTPTDQFGTPTGSAFEVNTANNQPFQILAFTSPQALTPGGYYSVRIRPVFSNGAGNYGTPQCIHIFGNPPVILNSEEEAEDELTEESLLSAFLIYPNPGNGRITEIYISDPVETSAQIQINDQTGRTVYYSLLNFEKEVRTPIAFEPKLSAGMYFITARIGNKEVIQKLLIE